tara:strand:+ start:499 stop:630 length:132 start_codon:yes stop_codon:yes gene_type:complete
MPNKEKNSKKKVKDTKKKQRPKRGRSKEYQNIMDALKRLSGLR